MKQHFLQSEAWARFQHALGNKTVRREGDGWSYLAVVEHGGGLTRLYCPYGPVVASLDALDAALVQLKKDAREIGAAFLRLQPTGILLNEKEAKTRGLSKIQYSQPVATRIIDLSPTFEELIAAISQSKRSVCRNYHKKGLTYRVSRDPADVEQLLVLLHDVAERNRIAVHSDDYIRKQAASLLPDRGSLHFIDLEGAPVSGAFLLEGDSTYYYAHAGTAAQHYALQANTALVGELIKYAKEAGAHTLDLYGIAPDDDPAHRWAGITSFKAGFGGEVVHYNPTYDMPLKKLAYNTYQLLRSVKKRLP